MKAKIEVGIMGQRSGSAIPNLKVIRNTTHLASLISNMGLQKEVQDEVIVAAKAYPEGSLDFFWNNIHNHIRKIQEKLKIPFHVDPPQEENTEKRQIAEMKITSVAKNLDDAESQLFGTKKKEKPQPIKKEKLPFLPGLPIKDGQIDLDVFVKTRQDALTERIRELEEKERARKND